MAGKSIVPAILRTDHEGRPLGTVPAVVLFLALLLLVLTPVWLAFTGFGPDIPSWKNPGAFGFHVSDLLPSALAIGTVIATLRRRRVALELAGWTMLTAMATGGPYLPVLRAALSLASWIPLLVLRNRVFAPRVPGAGRPLFGAIRLTIALFLVLEITAGVLVGDFFRMALKYREARFVTPSHLTWEPGRPTFATLGSSPANMERVHHRPFTIVLGERLADRFNFLFFPMSGVDSAKLVAFARTLAGGDRKVDAILLYAGFQDYNLSDGAMAMLRELAPLEQVDGAPDLVRTAIVESHLMRLGVFLARRWQVHQAEGRSGGAVDSIFDGYRQNVDAILKIAADAGIHVFAITLAKDRDSCSEESNRYQDLVNAYLRGLEAGQAHVTVVDFEKRVREKYPDGPLPSCEPYEGPVAGSPARCGDAYHLGPEGHAFLADVLEPVLKAWKPR